MKYCTKPEQYIDAQESEHYCVDKTYSLEEIIGYVIFHTTQGRKGLKYKSNGILFCIFVQLFFLGNMTACAYFNMYRGYGRRSVQIKTTYTRRWVNS